MIKPKIIAQDGALIHRRGTRDPDETHDEFLDEVISWVDEQLVELGFPAASGGRWRKVKREQPKPSLTDPSQRRVLANLSGALQRARNEPDPNRKLNFTFWAGWEAAAEKANWATGGDVRAKRKARRRHSHGAGKTNAAHKLSTPKRLEKMRALVVKGLSVTNASEIVFKDGLGKSAGANRRLWTRHHAKGRK